jgi:hypothetical protein
MKFLGLIAWTLIASVRRSSMQWNNTGRKEDGIRKSH